MLQSTECPNWHLYRLLAENIRILESLVNHAVTEDTVTGFPTFAWVFIKCTIYSWKTLQCGKVSMPSLKPRQKKMKVSLPMIQWLLQTWAFKEFHAECVPWICYICCDCFDRIKLQFPLEQNGTAFWGH